MAYINFRKVKLADWNSMNSMNKDPNTRYTVFNTDGTIYGEFIGSEPVINEELDDKVQEHEVAISSLEGDLNDLTDRVGASETDIGVLDEKVDTNVAALDSKIVGVAADLVEEVALKVNKADLASFMYNNAEGVDENNYRYKPGIKEDDEAELQIEGKKLYKSLLKDGSFSKVDENGNLIGASSHENAALSNENGYLNMTSRPNNISLAIRPRIIFDDIVLKNTKLYIHFQNVEINPSHYGFQGMPEEIYPFIFYNLRYEQISLQNFSVLTVSQKNLEYLVFNFWRWFDLTDEEKLAWKALFKNITVFNIDELIEDKLYSPMFDTTFDLMDDDEIKEQMDAWVSSASDYLAGGGWTDFKTNVPANLAGRVDGTITLTRDSANEDRVYLFPNSDGSFDRSGDRPKMIFNPNHRILVMTKVLDGRPGNEMRLYGETTKEYLNYSGFYHDSETKIAVALNTVVHENYTGLVKEEFKVLNNEPGSAVGDDVTFQGLVVLDLTALGEPDNISATQAYEKYGPMFDRLAKGPNMFPTNVEVVEGSTNLAMPDLTGKTDLGDGWYRITSQSSGRTTIDFNVKTGFWRVNKAAGDRIFNESGMYIPRKAENDEFLTFNLTDVSADVWDINMGCYFYISRGMVAGRITSDLSVVYTPFTGLATYDGEIRTWVDKSEGKIENLMFRMTLNKGIESKPWQLPLSDVTIGQFNPGAHEIQSITYSPRRGASLSFNDLEDGNSQPQYAKDRSDLSGSLLKFNDDDIKDDWSSIISKTNSSVVKLDDHEKRLGDVEDIVISDQYNTQVGVTSKEFKYYNLSGLKKDSNVKLHGKGQMIKNMVSHSIKTQTVDGLTITYDESTGYINLNGTYTGNIRNIDLVVNPPIDAAPGEWLTLIRYYGGGTVDLKGAYIGYVLQGSSVSHRINENSEALYDPYISSSGVMVKDNTSDKDESGKIYKQRIIFQIWKTGMVFNNFKFRLALYKGTVLQGYALPNENGATSEVEVFNRTINSLSPSLVSVPTSTTRGLTFEYNEDTQTFVINGTASSTGTIDLTKNISATDGQRLSLTRYYVSGEATIGGTVASMNIEGTSTVTMNQLTDDNYWSTSHSTGTKTDDGNVKIQLTVVSGQVYDNYTFKLMLSEESTPLAKYVNYKRVHAGFLTLNGTETAMNDFIEFPSIPYGVLEIVEIGESQNLQYGFSISDLANTTLEYSSEIFSSNLDTSILTERTTNLDNPFRGKIIAIWGDSRESNNPTSEVGGGSQLDTSWPTLLGNKLGASVLNFGLSGGSWAVNTVQSDADAAIVNRVEKQDPNASADIIIISSFNDFKLYTPLGSSDPSNVDKTTYYGAMRTTYKTLYGKYPGKRIYVLLPQKRYDEGTRYSTGASYQHYRDAQIEVANEYSIPIIDLYDLMPGKKGTQAYNTYMLNDTHWNAVGNERVAELVARHLIGGGNTVSRKELPPLPQSDGNYVLKLVITNGIPSFSWETE